MPTQVQFRRANTSDMASITGANGEIIVDTEKMVVVVHDGVAQGGFPMAGASDPTFEGNASFEVVKLGNGSVNVFSNSTLLSVANSSQQLNLRSNRLTVGISTVNSLALAVGSNVVVNASALRIGNSSVNTVVNSSFLNVASAKVRTNNFSHGSSNVAANGFSVESNNLVKAWGSVEANDSVGDVSFETEFGEVFAVQLTPETSTPDPTKAPFVTAKNTTTLNVRTSNTTAITVHYEVIGNNA